MFKVKLAAKHPGELDVSFALLIEGRESGLLLAGVSRKAT